MTEIAALLTSISLLIGSIAWPAIVISISLLIYSNRSELIQKSKLILADRTVSKFAIGPTGFSAELAEKVTKAVVESTEKSQQATLNKAEITSINKSAQDAIEATHQPSINVGRKFCILWIDDHPENNISLQYAFQMLGMVVVSIDSNRSIDQAFRASNGFDVVITDMHRDGLADKSSAEPLAGEETVSIIRSKHATVPVIIFANYYAKVHANDILVPPVVKITNSPRVVFSTVTEIAKSKPDAKSTDFG